MTYSGNRTAAGCAAAALAVALLVAGCGKSGDSSSETSSAASTSAATSSAETSAPETSAEASAAPGSVAAPAAYFPLLMKAESIPPTPAGPFVGEPPEDHTKAGGAPDVRQTYKSGDNSIMSSIDVLPDAATATEYAKATADATTSEIVGGAPAPAPNVTTDAKVVNGTSKDGTASMSVLVFSEENTVVTLMFMGKPGDAVSPDYLDSVGVIQLDAIQQGLPEIGG